MLDDFNGCRGNEKSSYDRRLIPLFFPLKFVDLCAASFFARFFSHKEQKCKQPERDGKKTQDHKGIAEKVPTPIFECTLDRVRADFLLFIEDSGQQHIYI